MQQAALPIYRAALELAVYMEQTVRHFDRYHKYTVGTDLRQKSKGVLFGISRAHLAEEKLPALVELRDSCEEMKMLIQITKELKAFKNFKQFEHSSLLVVTVCKQAQAWLNAAKKSRGGGSINVLNVPLEKVSRRQTSPVRYPSQNRQRRSAERAEFTVRHACRCA